MHKVSFVFQCSETDLKIRKLMFGAEDVLAKLSSFDAVHLSGISLAVLYPESRERLLSAMEHLAAQGVNISFDFNFRPHLWGKDPEKNSAPHFRRLARVCRWVFA